MNKKIKNTMKMLHQDQVLITLKTGIPGNIFDLKRKSSKRFSTAL